MQQSHLWLIPKELTAEFWRDTLHSSTISNSQKWKWKSLSLVDSATPWTIQSMKFSSGVGSLSLFQGISLTQQSNPGFPHCRQVLSQLSHKGSPRILEWADYPFSRASSWPRNWTGVSCIAGGFFTNLDIRETQRWKQFKCLLTDE